MSEPTELLPEQILRCPFCGAAAGDIKLSRGHGYIIGCGTCQGQQFAMTRDEAVKLWNTRVQLPAQAEPTSITEQARVLIDREEAAKIADQLNDWPRSGAAMQIANEIRALPPVHVHGPAVSECVEVVKRLRDENQRNYEYWKSIASNPETDFGVLKWAAWAGEDERVITALTALQGAAPNLEQLVREQSEEEERCRALLKQWDKSDSYEVVPLEEVIAVALNTQAEQLKQVEAERDALRDKIEDDGLERAYYDK